VAGSGAFADGVVVGLGSRSASTEEDIKVEASAALDDHGWAWWWSEWRSKRRTAESGAEHRRRRKGNGGLSPAPMRKGIKPPRHVGWIRSAATGPVAGGGGTRHRLPRLKPDLGRGQWAWPSKRFFQYSKSAQTCKFKSSVFSMFKIFKLCMSLDLNILNNFLNWVDFKFQT
jgi:hypothetical protein